MPNLYSDQSIDSLLVSLVSMRKRAQTNDAGRLNDSFRHERLKNVNHALYSDSHALIHSVQRYAPVNENSGPPGVRHHRDV